MGRILNKSADFASPYLRGQQEFEFSQKDFDWVRSELYDYAGIVLSEHKRDMAYNRLARQLRRLGLHRFSQYIKYLDDNPEEFSQFINAMTTNLTSFYRERHHFEFIKNTLIPELTKNGSNRLRVWSAGCSMGEEPYSLAMTLNDSIEDLSQWDIKILATDIDSKVLACASAGVYDSKRVERLERTLVRRFFLRGRGSVQGQVKIRPEVQRMISFRELNLMSRWPVKGPFDFVFCRNVMIYFDHKTQRALLDKMADVIKPGGYLFVGHSESPFRLTQRFKLVGKTIYKRVN